MNLNVEAAAIVDPERERNGATWGASGSQPLPLPCLSKSCCETEMRFARRAAKKSPGASRSRASLCGALLHLPARIARRMADIRPSALRRLQKSPTLGRLPSIARLTAGEPTEAQLIRTALNARVAPSVCPAFWRDATAAAGVLGTDQFLSHLARSTVAQIRALTKAADATRVQIREARAALHAAVEARCDRLEGDLASAEAAKVGALKRELMMFESTQERWRAERDALGEVALSLSDAGIVSQQATLVAHADGMDAMLRPLPTAPVEPPVVKLSTADMPALLAQVAGFGRVLAPRPVAALHLSLTGFPRFVRPGDSLCLRLALQGESHAAQTSEEVDVALASAAAQLRVAASLVPPGVASRGPVEGAAAGVTTLSGAAAAPASAPAEGGGAPSSSPTSLPVVVPASLSVDAAKRHLLVTLPVPASAQHGSSVVISSVTLRGAPVMPAGSSSFPPIGVLLGLLPPMRLEGAASSVHTSSPCVAPGGVLYAPAFRAHEVRVFDADGTLLPSLPLAGLGLSAETRWAAWAGGGVGSPLPATLLLAGGTGEAARLVAIDPVTRGLRWATPPGALAGCAGVAALPAQGVVVVAPLGGKQLLALRLSDGLRVGSAPLPEGGYFVAADAAAGTIFCGLTSADQKGGADLVGAWSWGSSGSSGSGGGEPGFEARGPVSAAGARDSWRPLAVVPPGPGRRAAHLVVGAFNQPELRVLSLPGLALVHSHTLEGMRVTGLAADPAGVALVVCDRASKSIHVLAWPLPGMPVLE